MREVTLVFVLLSLFGCRDWYQQGRFSVSGERSLSLSSHAGRISIVKGHALDSDSQVVGSQQNLIYLVVVCPGLDSHGSSSTAKSDHYTTTLNYTWEGKSGPVAVSIEWDRRTDTIAIGGKEVARDKGNVFVIRREPGGQVVGQQITSLGPADDFSGLLRHVQEQLPNDDLVVSLRTHKSDN